MNLSTYCQLCALYFTYQLIHELYHLYWAHRMVQYMREHPDECDLCAYFYVCMHEEPPPHNCAEERASWQ